MDQLRARCISQILRQLFAGLLDHVQLSVIIDRFYVFLFCFWGVSAFRVHLQFLLCLRSNNYHYLSDRRMIIKLVSVLIMQFLLVSCQQQSSALHIKGCDMKLAKQLTSCCCPSMDTWKDLSFISASYGDIFQIYFQFCSLS